MSQTMWIAFGTKKWFFHLYVTYTLSKIVVLKTVHHDNKYIFCTKLSALQFLFKNVYPMINKMKDIYGNTILFLNEKFTILLLGIYFILAGRFVFLWFFKGIYLPEFFFCGFFPHIMVTVLCVIILHMQYFSIIILYYTSINICLFVDFLKILRTM